MKRTLWSAAQIKAYLSGCAFFVLMMMLQGQQNFTSSVGGACKTQTGGNFEQNGGTLSNTDAQAVLNTGDPESAVWGPTAFLDAGDFAGGSVHYAFVGQDAVSGDNTWPEHYSAITLTGANTGALVYDVDTPFNDGTRGVENTGAELTAGYFANLSATDVDTSQNYIMIWVGKPSHSGVGADHLSVLEGGTGPDLRFRGNNSTNLCQPSFNSGLGQEVMQGPCIDDTWCVCIGITHGAASRGGWSYGQGFEVDDEAQAPLGGAGATILGINSNQTGNNGDTGPNVTAAVIYIDGHTLADEPAAHAWARKAADRIMGAYNAGGTAVHGRSTTAMLRVCDPDTDTTTTFHVNNNWPRREIDCGYGEFADPTASETLVSGYLFEDSGTNILGFGTVLDDAAWTKINSSTVDANQQDDPAGDATLDDIDGVTGSGEHGVSAAETLTAAEYAFSAVFKPGNQTFAYLDVSSIANVSAYFDSSDCQPDTVGSAATAYGWNYGGLCYVGIGYTGTAASHTHRLLCAEADGDKDYAGAAGDCAYGWANIVQHERVTSPILTIDATDVARDDDSFYWGAPSSILNDARTGTIIADFQFDGDYGAGVRYALQISDQGSSSNMHRLQVSDNSDQRVILKSLEDDFSNLNGDPGSGRLIERFTFEEDDHDQFVNGVYQTGAASGTPPDGLDRVELSHVNGPLEQLIYQVRMYPGVIGVGEQGTGDDTP